MGNGVICGFCGEAVDETAVDPCALVVVTGWAGPEDDQLEQQLFTHAACLRARLHPDVAVHAEFLDAAAGPPPPHPRQWKLYLRPDP